MIPDQPDLPARTPLPPRRTRSRTHRPHTTSWSPQRWPLALRQGVVIALGAAAVFAAALHFLPRPAVPPTPTPPVMGQFVSGPAPGASAPEPSVTTTSAAAHGSGILSGSARPAVWTAADRELYLYHHYADFTRAQCRLLPPAYVGGCLAGAVAQAPVRPHDPIVRREQLSWLYVRGTTFSHAGCTLLPTDSVAACQARFAAPTTRAARRPAQSHRQRAHAVA